MFRKLMLLAAVVLAGAGHAQQFLNQPPYEKVLIPVLMMTPAPGAYGSLWVSKVIVRNEATVPVVFAAETNAICTLAPYCPSAVGPRSTIEFMPDENIANPNAGVLLYVGAPGKGKLSIFARVQDLSRQSETWGTSIPVVRERDVFTSALQLAALPVTPEFRSALRVYDFDSEGDLKLVRIRIFPVGGSTALVDATVPLQPQGSHQPRFAMIPDLVAAFPQIAAQSQVRVEISPETAGLRFWAFASITNNATQHVTVIAPD